MHRRISFPPGGYGKVIQESISISPRYGLSRAINLTKPVRDGKTEFARIRNELVNRPLRVQSYLHDARA